MPFLSIIIPVYNKQEYVESCIQSVLNQTFTDYELILVNDGSTDLSGEICDNYAKMDKRIVVLHQKNQGVSSARNLGLAHAYGNYIGFIDSDDQIENDMFELLVRNAQRNDADVSMVGVRKIFTDKEERYFGTNTCVVFDRVEAISRLLKRQIPRSIYDKIFKSEIAKGVHFEGSIYEDIFYNFLVFNSANRFVFHDVLKYNYIIRDNSVSMSKFSRKYMDSVAFTKRIVAITQEKIPSVIDEAKKFDFVTNISLLNTILIGGKQTFKNEYKEVVKNLKEYEVYLPQSSIKLKHKCAYYLFRTSPIGYRLMMKLYCKITNADVSKKQ